MSADVGRCRSMSGHVGNTKFRPGVVTNVGVAVEIASASLSVHKLLLLPFLAAAMLDFPLPGFAGNCIIGSREMLEP